MRRLFTIPLSYNPLDPGKLAGKLSEYTARHHDDIIIDFESKLSENTGAKYTVALSSGTSAIHLGLKAMGIGKDDLVLVSTFTYVATVNPILYLDAVPVLIDSEDKTWNMDPDLLEQAVQHCIKEGKKPKAILIVHTYGMPAQMDRIVEISRRYAIPVLEDAAEAIGSSYKNKPLGTWGEVGILSFNNNKILTTFGGGALQTNNSSIAEKVLRWSTQSRENLPHHEHVEIGFNYRLGPVNAAVGLVELEGLKNNIDARRKIFTLYKDRLSNFPGVKFQSENADSFSNRWITCVLLPNNLEKIRQSLDEANIETRPLWKPMHLQPLFKRCLAFVNGSSERLFNEGMCLPSGNGLMEEEINEIVAHFLR